MNSRLKSILIGSAVAATLIFPSLASTTLPVAAPAAPAPAAQPAADAEAAPEAIVSPETRAKMRDAERAARTAARDRAREQRDVAHAQAEEAATQIRAQAEVARDMVRAQVEAARAQAHAQAQAARDMRGHAYTMLAMNDNGGQWVKWPTKTYGTKAVKLDDIVGTVVIVVKDGGPMTLDVSGVKSRVDGLDINTDGGVLTIEGSDVHDVWDWHNWFNFDIHNGNRMQNLTIKIGVPKGADVSVEDLVGNATIGDTYGPLKFEAAATEAKIGKVGKANVSLAGAGKVDIAAVNGPLSLDIAGSGRVNVGPVNGKLSADVAGAGDATVGVVSGGLSVDIAGSGDLTVASVKGRTSIDIAGSGSVKIADGEANPLHVDIMGSGNLDFGGMAVDPKISALGSGNVRLKAYRGKLTSDGMASVKIGDKTVTVKEDDGDDDDNDN